MIRLFRFGPRQVINQLLGARDALFTEARQELQIVSEARALRPWEEFDEQVFRWWFQVTIPLVAAQQPVVQLNGLDVPAQLPPGSLWTIDTAMFAAGQSVRVAVACQDSAAWDTPGTQPAGPVWRDQRIAPSAARVPLVIRSGNDVNPGGTNVADLSGAVEWELGFVGANAVGVPVPGFPAVENVNFIGNTAGGSISVTLRGRIIIAQQ